MAEETEELKLLYEKARTMRINAEQKLDDSQDLVEELKFQQSRQSMQTSKHLSENASLQVI